MKLSVLLISIVIAMLTLGSVGHAQLVPVIYYVDPSGIDGNTGGFPFQHIQYAVTRAAADNLAGKDVEIRINPGTYRECVVFPTQVYTAHTISLVASNPSILPVLDGADVWNTGWILVSGAIYEHPYTSVGDPSDFCTGAQCSPSDSEPEQVWYSGALLQQTQSSALTAPGQFFVDSAAGQIYAWMPGGANPNSLLTEVTTGSSLLSVDNTGLQFLTIDGLVVQRSADYPLAQTMASFQGINKSLILRNLTARYSSEEGIFIACAGGAGGSCRGNGTGTFVMTNVHADNNGFIGMDLDKTKNLVATNITTNGNTYKERLPGSTLRDSFEAGVKFGSIHDATINGWTANNNDSPGFWLDSDAARVTVTNLVANRNAGAGLVSEANQGPLTVSSATICQNATQLGGPGVFLPVSENVTLGSTPGAFIVFANDPNSGNVQGIGMGDDSGLGRLAVDFETGAAVTLIGKNITVNHAVVYSKNSGLNGDYIYLNNLSAAHADAFWSSFHANSNVYWDPQIDTVFVRSLSTPVSTFATYLTWLSAGQETSSVYANPFSNDPTNTCTFTGVPGVWPR